MKHAATVLNAALVAASLLLANAANAADYAVGADVSFLRQAEQQGVAFKENGRSKPACRSCNSTAMAG